MKGLFLIKRQPKNNNSTYVIFGPLDGYELCYYHISYYPIVYDLRNRGGLVHESSCDIKVSIQDVFLKDPQILLVENVKKSQDSEIRQKLQ